MDLFSYSLYNGNNSNQKDKINQFKCAMECLKKGVCKMAIINEKKCSIQHEIIRFKFYIKIDSEQSFRFGWVTSSSSKW
ncbi:hypothetical protein BpHYR1_027907 [Brachionus plicatilis]|uniref:Uncharacterized protein n=1 Tax=Brachionus plicatilis TaxID=10195 RepID=A0A3M7SBS8_BRAPC|nr:hypothetical protein BpHYR1_027907 [Brachionus plicatilis]